MGSLSPFIWFSAKHRQRWSGLPQGAVGERVVGCDLRGSFPRGGSSTWLLRTVLGHVSRPLSVFYGCPRIHQQLFHPCPYRVNSIRLSSSDAVRSLCPPHNGSEEEQARTRRLTAWNQSTSFVHQRWRGCGASGGAPSGSPKWEFKYEPHPLCVH